MFSFTHQFCSQMSSFFDFILIHRVTVLLITSKNKETFRALFFEQLKQKIEQSYIHDIKHEGIVMEFNAPIFRHIWNGWNVFNTVTKARFRLVLQGHVPRLKAELNFLELFVTLILLSLTSFTAFYQGSIGWGIAIIVAALLVYIITRFVAMNRVAKLAEDIRQKINNPDAQILSFYELFKDDIEFVNEVFIKRPQVIAVG